MAEEIGLSNVCRACMKVGGVLLPMYGNYVMSKKNFPDKLADLASIRIDEYDGLPNVLCAKCAYRTEAFHEFKLQVKATEKKLQKLFDLRTTESDIFPKAEFLDDNDNDNGKEHDVYDVPVEDNYAEQKNLLPETEAETTHDSGRETIFESAEFMKAEDCEYIEDRSAMEGIVVASAVQENLENWQYVRSESSSETTAYALLYIADDNKIAIEANEELPSIEENTRRTGETDEGAFFDTSTDDSSLREFNNYAIAENPSFSLTKKESSPAEAKLDDRRESASSDDSVDAVENLLGSLNDTITRIKEIKMENGEGRLYQCTLCMENYDELTDVLAHTVETHVPKSGPFFCVVCEKDCTSHKELRSHVKSHTGKYPYSCFVCNKAYSMKRYLKRHMSCHTDLPRHRCPKCGERFNLKNDLETHLSSHVYTGPPFVCSQCPRVFNHKGNYKRHLVSHLDPRGIHLPKYPCEICGKRFINNRTLQTHTRVHTGEKPFECDVCKRSFSQRGNLLNHQRIHSNPRSYTCEVCGKRFNQRATLRDHGLLHTGEKPYVCNVCGVAFTFSAALRRHLWSHATDKPFGCEICNARFVGKYDIKRHMKIHTDRPNNRRTNNRIYPRDDDDNNKSNDISNVIDTKIFIDEAALLNDDSTSFKHTEEETGKEDVHVLLNLIEYR